MKPKTKAQEQIDRLQHENTILLLALSDHVRDRVTWFRKGSARLGICREAGASGGIVIERQGADVVGAYYWEPWFERVRSYCPESTNKEAHDLRDCAYLVQAHVRTAQNPQIVPPSL